VALAEQLLEQARHLAFREVSGRPRQAQLRRAVSSAYYGLFHFLVDKASRLIVGGGGGNEAIRAILSRTFEHASMKRTSAAFASGSLPNKLAPGLAGGVIPPNLQKIAKTFRTRQSQRHDADYDLLLRFSRADVASLIDDAELAMKLWPTVAADRAARLYLLALFMGERIRD
jgi:uncharacterized protein (UPF0332 family)